MIVNPVRYAKSGSRKQIRVTFTHTGDVYYGATFSSNGELASFKEKYTTPSTTILIDAGTMFFTDSYVDITLPDADASMQTIYTYGRANVYFLAPL
jgi:hypothetical protein